MPTASRQVAAPDDGFVEPADPSPSATEEIPTVSRIRFRLSLLAGLLLVVVGLGATAYGFYQSFVTDWLAARSQDDLAVAFENRTLLATTADSVITRAEYVERVDLSEAIDDPTMALAAFDDENDVPVLPRVDPDQSAPVIPSAATPWVYEAPPSRGEPLGRLVIPQADVEWLIVEGVEVENLRQGPGHMPNTAVPGQFGNAVISGHRTTYGAPFFHLDRLVPGDRFTIETVIGTHTFEVIELRIVEPTDVWVTGQWEGSWLTLTTCNPLYSAQERLIVFSKLVDGPNATSVEEQFGDDYTIPTPSTD